MPIAKKVNRLTEELEIHTPAALLKFVESGCVYMSLVKSFPLVPITNQSEHTAAVEVAKKVSEHLNQNEELAVETKKVMMSYLETLSGLIEGYEKKRYPGLGRNVKGVDVLRFLMEEHGLKQTDLAETMGGQSVVSELLAGKRGRELNRKQIETLSRRFHVSPSVFFDRV
ncbi:MAG TPA: transcriptional regulator [Bdellovibrionota bacterium]|nr:transcriptional regulator [Bdellovibrionota bacterium]